DRTCRGDKSAVGIGASYHDGGIAPREQHGFNGVAVVFNAPQKIGRVHRHRKSDDAAWLIVNGRWRSRAVSGHGIDRGRGGGLTAGSSVNREIQRGGRSG